MQEAPKGPLVPWLAGRKKIRVAVVGDVILDEYLDGQVNRISPEAPVPVHLVTRTLHGAGGAANTARNIKLAGGEAHLLSVTGDDEAGRQLRELLRKDKIDVSGLLTCQDRPTVRKTRIRSSNQQIVRIDWEHAHPIAMEAQERILARLKELSYDALLISDYGKGALPINLLSNLISEAVARGVPIAVDPKGRDYGKYLHATLLTPNRKEACDALGLDPASDIAGAELGRRLQKTFGLRNVLVTLGAKGMVLVPEPGSPLGEEPIELPAIAREVYDVSGAGDTVVAVMSLCLAAKAPLEHSMHIAQTAAALVVAKWGTQPVQLDELEAALRERPDSRRNVFSTQRKITTADDLRLVLEERATRTHRVVFTNGCFDLLHAGHVAYLERARSLGDVLVVGVNSDASVRGLKGAPRPYIPLENRMRLLAALACVDHVVPFDEATPYNLISALVPDVLVKGADYAKDEIVGGDVVRQAGGVVDTIEFLPGLSTSAIVEKIRTS